MNNIKEAYLNSKANAWSYTTYKGEASRLASIPDHYLPNNPEGFYRHCIEAGYKPYTIKTLFIRATQLAGFGWPKQANEFKAYMQTNARLFKSVYTPKRPPMDFKTAVARIRAELSAELAAQAFALLASGLRISEANQVSMGSVVGKGNKIRAVHNAPTVKVDAHKLRRALRPLGLTPHLLRKLAATRAVELGAREADLLAMFGWSSMQTAGYYVQAVNTSDVAKKLQLEVDP